VYNDSHGSSVYGSDWLPLSTDGLVVTMTAADCKGRWFDDSGIFTRQTSRSRCKLSQERQQKNNYLSI
jgi:hypothetical protein